MRHLYLILFLVFAAAGAQNVAFADPNLKTKLTWSSNVEEVAWDENGELMSVDANGDGEIQVSEALAVYSLDLSFGDIQDFDGLQAFTNLRKLVCGFNDAPTIDLSTFANLEELDASSGEWTSFDITALVNLKRLNISSQSPVFTSLDLSNNNLLEYLNIGTSSLTSIDLSNLTLLEDFSLFGLNVTAVDLSNNLALKRISIWNTPLTSIDVTMLTNLEQLNLVNNGLTSVNVLPLINLLGLQLNNNPLGSVDISTLTSLRSLSVEGCGLSSIDLSNNNQLRSIRVTNNNLTALDISNKPDLWTLYCANNQLTEIDLSNNPLLCNFVASDNPQLETLFLKNGNEGCPLEFQVTNVPMLYYVCVDDAETEHFTQYFGSGVVVNSYCNFTPGGDYNTITGTVRFDADVNGCDGSDPVHPLVKIAITDGMENGATFTATDGTYNFYTGAGTFDVVPQLENPSYFNVVPIASASFPDVDNSVETRDFCIVPNGIHRDLEVVIAPVVAARPGFEAVYKIVYRNKGNQTISMSLGLDFSYNPDLMAFTSATTAPDSAGPGLLQWNYSGLQPFESRSILVTMQINPPTHPTNPVNIDDELTFTALVEMMGADDMPQDNVFQLVQTVVGSYDPNNMICLEGDTVPVSSIGEYLHYITNFENTGTDYAENVVVKIEFDDMNFDLNSLQLMDSSDPVYARITGNKVEYIFEGIYLGIGGHGNILLKIRTNFGLSAGDMVANNADIYFDYNHPVVTDMASTLFQSLQTPGYIRDASVVVYPNPSSGMVNVKSASSVTKVELFDTHGRLLQMKIGGMADGSLDMSSRAKGIYFLRITTSDGIHIEKLIRD